MLKMFIVEIYLVKDGIPIVLCLKFVMWNVCLMGFTKILYCSIDRTGIKNQ